MTFLNEVVVLAVHQQDSYLTVCHYVIAALDKRTNWTVLSVSSFLYHHDQYCLATFHECHNNSRIPRLCVKTKDRNVFRYMCIVYTAVKQFRWILAVVQYSHNSQVLSYSSGKLVLPSNIPNVNKHYSVTSIDLLWSCLWFS